MSALITIQDIQALKPLSANNNSSKKVEPYVIEAQEFDIRPLLGDEFYKAVFDAVQLSIIPSPYGVLWNGSTYTVGSIQYENPGLKKVLIYYSYARIIADSNVTNTAFGMVQKMNNDSEPITEKTLARIVGQARAGGKAYENRFIDFLIAKSADYPLWRCAEENRITGGVRISSVRKGDRLKPKEKERYIRRWNVD